MIGAEGLYYFLALAAIIILIWCIVSAYNRRVEEIEKLREDLEKLKEELRR